MWKLEHGSALSHAEVTVVVSQLVKKRGGWWGRCGG
jgi:hypothetical protein